MSKRRLKPPKRESPPHPPSELSTRELFERYRAAPEGKEREAIQDELFTRYSRLVVGLAKRFKDKGEPFQDLVQVGYLGLLLAISRYEPERNTEFVSFATPTILGEIRRYFRDKGWTIRVPRRLQELNLRVHRELPELLQILGRKPTVNDIAEHLQVSPEEVLEALEIGQAYSPLSLDTEHEVKPGHNPTTLQNISGTLDPNLVGLSLKTVLKSAILQLPERDRQLLEWRFFENLTQAEIARLLKVSQMQVSRLQKIALNKLRQSLKNL